MTNSKMSLEEFVNMKLDNELEFETRINDTNFESPINNSTFETSINNSNLESNNNYVFKNLVEQEYEPLLIEIEKKEKKEYCLVNEIKRTLFIFILYFMFLLINKYKS